MKLIIIRYKTKKNTFKNKNKIINLMNRFLKKANLFKIMVKSKILKFNQQSILN